MRKVIVLALASGAGFMACKHKDEHVDWHFCRRLSVAGRLEQRGLPADLVSTLPKQWALRLLYPESSFLFQRNLNPCSLFCCP